MVSTVVHSGCLCYIPWSNICSLQTIEMHFSLFWRLGRPTSRSQRIGCLVSQPSSSHRATSQCVLTRQKRARELSGVSFIRTGISFMRIHPPDLIASQTPHLSDLALGVKFQHMYFGGYKHSVSGSLLNHGIRNNHLRWCLSRYL